MSRIDTQALKRITSTLLSYAGVALFFWAIYPYKWARRLFWVLRRERAKSIARSRANEERKAMYVIQNKMHFTVHSRAEVRKQNTKLQRKLDDNHKGYVKWDYRNGLIFVAYQDGTEETIDRTPKKKEEKK